MNEYVVFSGIFCFFAGLLIAYLIQGRIASRKIRESEAEADRCIKESEKKAATLLKEADLEVKDRHFKLKNPGSVKGNTFAWLRYVSIQ